MSSGMQAGFDQAKADTFAEMILTALNHGALCLMMSVGHRTGLFDAMREAPPERSEEVAARVGLNERYVREWLGAMVTGRVVDFDPATRCFSLPPEHAAFLTLDLLRGINRTLKSDGVYLMQDISGTSHLHQDVDHPIGTFLYTISCMHCMTVSLAQGGEGVGAMWGEEMTRTYLVRAGFGSVTTHRLSHDIQNNWYVATK